jgi:putative flavoprotein involved in K+ transport
VQLSTEVRTIGRSADHLHLETSTGPVEADQVVVATGPFQTPFVPQLASRLDPDVVQTHSVGYRRPDDVPPGTVLVVGGGNTGFQIAEELAGVRAVHLSIGSRQTPLPQRFLGRDLFWWLTRSRLLATTVDSRLGRRLRHRDTLIGSSPRRLRRRGVLLRPRAVDASERTVRFEDGSALDVEAVIWATGYRSDYSWIDLPVVGEGGGLRHRRGVTEVPGLTFLGLTWQHTRGSALLGWVRDDAEHIAERIAESLGPAGSGRRGSRQTAEVPG